MNPRTAITLTAIVIAEAHGARKTVKNYQLKSITYIDSSHPHPQGDCAIIEADHGQLDYLTAIFVALPV